MRVTDFGAFVELETGIEGLIHISELSEERVEKPEDVVKVGEPVKARVMSIDKAEKKIALSKKNAENADVGSYSDDAGTTSALAAKLKDFNVKN